MKKRYVLLFIPIVITILIGIVKVNIEYNKVNGKAYDETVYANVYDDGRQSCDAFGEFVINKDKNVRIRMYFTKSPFDLRFAVGNKVFYINGSIFNNIKNSLYSKGNSEDNY